jgi:hypothetical protein
MCVLVNLYLFYTWHDHSWKNNPEVTWKPVIPLNNALSIH